MKVCHLILILLCTFVSSNNINIMEEINKEEYNVLTHGIIGAAMEVHKLMGPGLLEGVYEECLAEELTQRGLKVERQVSLPIVYKGKLVGHPLVIDMLVEDCIIVELKAVNELLDIYSAQLLSYLRLSKLKLGLLINFNSVRLLDGVKRIVNGF